MGQEHMNAMKCWVAAAAMVTLTGAARAELVNLGDGTVKDTNTNLIWLKNWEAQALRPLERPWVTQKNWADNLNFAGSTDWRLPDISEYRALYAAYGDLVSFDDPATNTKPFDRVFHLPYWSGTLLGSDEAWAFAMSSGRELLGSLEYSETLATAVRTAPVPEPQTWAMLIMGLGVVTAALRRRPR
jgi:hypothetical protein